MSSYHFQFPLPNFGWFGIDDFITAPVILGCGENLWPSQVQRHWLTTKRKFAIAYVPNARPANVQTCGAICGRAAEAAKANASGSTSYVVDNNGLTEKRSARGARNGSASGPNLHCRHCSGRAEPLQCSPVYALPVSMSAIRSPIRTHAAIVGHAAMRGMHQAQNLI